MNLLNGIVQLNRSFSVLFFSLSKILASVLQHHRKAKRKDFYFDNSQPKKFSFDITYKMFKVHDLNE